MKSSIQTTVIGSYPIDIDIQNMMNDYFHQQEIHWDSYISEAVQDMVHAGIDVVSDGQTRDPFLNIYLRKLEGCRIRQRAEIIDEIRYVKPITLPDVLIAKKQIPKSTQQVGLIAGPYTLCQSVVDQFYHDEQELAFAFARAMNQEALALQKHVALISIDEPFFSQEIPSYGKELIELVSDNITCPIRLHVCGNVSGNIEEIIEMPVDILSHEFKATPQLFDAFQRYSFSQKLCIGAVRSDQQQVESVNEIVTHIKKAKQLFDGKITQIAPDCGQRFLSRKNAFQKLQNLVRAKEEVYG